MRSGSPIQFDVALFDASGAGLSYANQAAFTAAGWSLSFIDMSTGSAVSPSLSYTISAVPGVDGRHTVRLTLTTAAWIARITPPNSAYIFMVLPGATWTGEQYDTDAIYARVNSVYGISQATSATTTALPAMIENDSYLATITVATAYLARLGWVNLTGVTLTGTIRDASDDGTQSPRAVLVPSAPTSAQGLIAVNGSDATAIDLSWVTYPSGMALTTPERSAGVANLRVSIEATKTGSRLTTIYASPLTVYRKDNPT